MRSALGQDIFKDELEHIYREQTERRNELKRDWKSMLEDIMERISKGTCENPIIEQKLIELSERLSKTKAKKQYGYLQKDVKTLIDSIVDELAQDGRIAELYDLWYEKKYDILKTYTSDLPPKMPLSENKEFKSIKNEIIREAMRLHTSGGTPSEVEPPRKCTSSDHTSTHDQNQNPPTGSPTSSPSKSTVSAVSVIRLFRSLANIFQSKIDSNDGKKMPTIDRRQRREIEEKRNAEQSFT